MADASFSASAYVVLGLLTVHGPGTPYDLKRWADRSVGYFWSFPRAQLYVEPERLARLGLVDEARQPSGRRRRVFRITAAGRQVLADWVRDSAPLPVEMRDPGLLKLYFAEVVDRSDVVALARVQAAQHAERLRTYQRLEPVLEQVPGAAFALATLQHGLRRERMSVEFWQEVERHPPASSVPVSTER